ncbi:hypothetical protein MBANPS3_011741 [Mucor bainieri]
MSSSTRNHNGIPPVVAASTTGRPTLGIRRQSAALPPPNHSNVIALLQEELKTLNAKFAMQELTLNAALNRISVLELCAGSSSSGNGRSRTGRRQRNPDASREVREAFNEHQKENNGVGVIIEHNAPNASEFHSTARKRIAKSSLESQGPIAPDANRQVVHAIVKESNRRATEHIKYQKTKARNALKPAEIILQKMHRAKLNSRRTQKMNRRHGTFVNNAQKYMRAINAFDSNVNFAAVNTLIQASVMMSDDEDHPDATNANRLRVRKRPAFRSPQFNEFCDALDADHAAESKGVLQHTICDTVIDDAIRPVKNFKGMFHKWAFTNDAWSTAE